MAIEDLAIKIQSELGDSWLPTIYRERVLKLRTRSYHFEVSTKPSTVSIQHTLLGVELKVGKRRLLCPDLATARYLSVFARLGCSDVAVPYDITQISWIADELESSWHRMMLLIDHLTEGRSERLRGVVTRRLINESRAEIESLGPGSRFPEFNQPARRRRT